MAQAQPEEKHQETREMETKDSASSTTTTAAANATSVSFKFNAHAPEFVPRTPTQVPISGYYYPCVHLLGGDGGSDWFYVGDQEPIQLISNSTVTLPNYSKNVLTDNLQQKIIKQVEYQFSDMSLLANESLWKQINKDPEGYVPISVIASTKKIKSLISNHHLLAQALRSSSALVVTDDSKKVKRKHFFTDKDREELQSRIVVAENLPEDHSHHNLEKIFGVVGRSDLNQLALLILWHHTCLEGLDYASESNSSRSKGDFVISNKLHALVEYEAPEIAEKAVEKLNDGRNWRKSLRVRLLLRCSPKSVLKSRKSEFDGILDNEESPTESAEDSCQPHISELVAENTLEQREDLVEAVGNPDHIPRIRVTTVVACLPPHLCYQAAPSSVKRLPNRLQEDRECQTERRVSPWDEGSHSIILWW
ncbi:hypothetical protein U1Q18_034962 [Sarracenia purpurea var. burkii]